MRLKRSISNREQIHGVIIALLVMLLTNRVGNAVELSGKVLAVDSAGRWITIERDKGDSKKPVTLDVADSVLAGEELALGTSVTLDYDPESEVVSRVRILASTTSSQSMAIAGGGKSINADEMLLQGIWIAVAVDRHGTMMTKQDLQDQSRRIVIDSNRITFEETHSDKLIKYGGTFTFDPRRKTLDLIGKGPMGADFNLLAIYQVSESELKFCYRRNGDGKAKRPTEFKAYKERPNFSMSYTCRRLSLD